MHSILMQNIMQMTNRKTVITAFVIFLFAVSFLIYITGRNNTFKVNTYKSGDGWGYDVLVKNKVYIHQPFLPAVEGNIPFENKSTARKTGDLVVKKLKKHKLPTITREEVKSITGQ